MVHIAPATRVVVEVRVRIMTASHQVDTPDVVTHMMPNAAPQCARRWRSGRGAFSAT